MAETVVDRLDREFRDIVARLDEMEISLRVTAEETFRKSLLLAAASHFERRVSQQILELSARHSSGTDLIQEFIRRRAVERQFHSLFNWNDNNANFFFALFGEGFKSYMKRIVSEDTEYADAIKAFLELCGNGIAWYIRISAHSLLRRAATKYLICTVVPRFL